MLPCAQFTLLLYTGPTENSRRLALWCGNENPRSLTSNSPSVYVMFQSNDRENYAGITLDFEVFGKLTH